MSHATPQAPRGHAVGFLASAGKLVSGHAAGYTVALLVAPVLARLYGPAEFGVFALFVTAVSCLTVTVTCRFEQAILVRRSVRAASAMAWAATLTTLLGSMLGIFVLVPLARWISTIDGVEVPDRLVGLLVLAVTGMAIYQVVASWLLRQGDYRQLAMMRVVFGVSMAAVQVAVPLLGGDTMLGLPAGQAVGFASAAFYAGLRSRDSWHPARPAHVRIVLRCAGRHRHFALFGVPATLASNLGIHGPAVLLASLYGVEAAGIFALAQRVFTTPLTLLTNSFSRVYYFEATNGAMRDRLPQLIRQVVFRTFWIAAAPITLVALLAPLTFGAVFGSQWAAAGWVCTVLAPMALALCVAQVVSPTFDVLNRQSLRMRREVVCSVLIFSGMLLAWWFNWSPLGAVATAAAGGTTGYLLLVTAARRSVVGWHPPASAPPAAPLARAA